MATGALFLLRHVIVCPCPTKAVASERCQTPSLLPAETQNGIGLTSVESSRSNHRKVTALFTKTAVSSALLCNINMS